MVLPPNTFTTYQAKGNRESLGFTIHPQYGPTPSVIFFITEGEVPILTEGGANLIGEINFNLLLEPAAQHSGSDLALRDGISLLLLRNGIDGLLL